MTQLLQQIAENYGLTLEQANMDQLSELLSALSLELETRHRERGSESRLIQSLGDEFAQTPTDQLIDIGVMVLVRLRFGPQLPLQQDFLTEDYQFESDEPCTKNALTAGNASFRNNPVSSTNAAPVALHRSSYGFHSPPPPNAAPVVSPPNLPSPTSVRRPNQNP